MNSTNLIGPRCPTCDLQVDVTGEGMPFCSSRCRLIDLGRWLNEEIAVPCEPPENDNTNAADDPKASVPQLPPGWHDA